MHIAATLRTLLLLLITAVGVQAIYALMRPNRDDLPWTALDLTGPAGAFTRGKIVALRADFPLCRQLLHAAGVRFTALPPRRETPTCGYADAVRLRHTAAGPIRYSPAGLGLACPVVAALTVWERETVQPAAERLLGSRVAEVEHFGSYSCRRINGRSIGDWSEHATASAIDVAGFRLADGRRITVARDWEQAGVKADFLHAVRDGSCNVFATTLSPDYNRFHHDHFHLDEADRGGLGWGVCR